ncbi:MAG: ATP-binding cassette domain-containing protein [Acidimicrobiales bacterium]
MVAVDDATIELPAGKLTVISGPSGSGKTTLLNLMLAWETPDNGRRHTPWTATTWAEIAVVPQRLGLIEHCTIGENVTLPGRVVGLQRELEPLLVRLSLEKLADRFPAETSLGEQQRAAVARALITAPRVLIADEPTSHQDEANTNRITELLREAADGGSAVVVATHDPRVSQHADEIYRIHDGKLSPGSH